MGVVACVSRDASPMPLPSPCRRETNIAAGVQFTRRHVGQPRIVGPLLLRGNATMRTPGTAHRSCIVTTELKEASDQAAYELGIGISEYLRLALIHLVNEREIPFKV
ncbi:MAG: hypothetical protein EON92_18240, partial [Burkholderiales bacterium]